MSTLFNLSDNYSFQKSTLFDFSGDFLFQKSTLFDFIENYYFQNIIPQKSTLFDKNSIPKKITPYPWS